MSTPYDSQQVKTILAERGLLSYIFRLEDTNIVTFS